MIDINKLPKTISYNDVWYTLNLHITFKNKICISYKYIGTAMMALEQKKEYNILSEVVEPDMVPCEFSANVLDILDVPTVEAAWIMLQSRVNQAITDKVIEVVY